MLRQLDEDVKEIKFRDCFKAFKVKPTVMNAAVQLNENRYTTRRTVREDEVAGRNRDAHLGPGGTNFFFSFVQKRSPRSRRVRNFYPRNIAVHIVVNRTWRRPPSERTKL